MKNKSQAFSFIEVMISVFLVSVGLLAALSLLTKGLRETMDSRNQVIASLLAQEGTELVRSIRDSNWANNNPTFQGIPNGTNSQQIDYKDATLASGNFQLKINNGFYQHSAGNNTKFFRKIIITKNSDEKADITSMVVWNGRTSNIFKDAKEDQDLDESNCNTINKCAYAKDTLTSWGE